MSMRKPPEPLQNRSGWFHVIIIGVAIALCALVIRFGPAPGTMVLPTAPIAPVMPPTLETETTVPTDTASLPAVIVETYFSPYAAPSGTFDLKAPHTLIGRLGTEPWVQIRSPFLQSPVWIAISNDSMPEDVRQAIAAL